MPFTANDVAIPCHYVDHTATTIVGIPVRSTLMEPVRSLSISLCNFLQTVVGLNAAKCCVKQI